MVALVLVNQSMAHYKERSVNVPCQEGHEVLQGFEVWGFVGAKGWGGVHAASSLEAGGQTHSVRDEENLRRQAGFSTDWTLLEKL